MEKIESKFKKEDGDPIVDIEVDKATLETWEKHGLKNAIHGLVNNDFERLVQLGERYVLCSENFACTNEFINEAEAEFLRFKAENLDEKIKEVEDTTKKSILNFAFKELEFDPNNPEIIKQEKIKQNNKELTIQYFKTNQENLILVFDGIDWWLERK